MIKDNVLAKTVKNVIYIQYYSYGELYIGILCSQLLE